MPATSFLDRLATLASASYEHLGRPGSPLE